MNFDPYYQRSEVSNSDLTALKLSLHPNLNFTSTKARNKAFHLGTLVDALVTEPKKCNHYRMTVDDEKYTKEEWKWGNKMLSVIRKASMQDAFLDYVLRNADGQRWFVNPRQEFNLGCYDFVLPTRCKFDWFLNDFGGDLKTTAAASQYEFENCIDFFDWDRSRAWYMDLVHSIDPRLGNQDFIYAISKKNFKVFFKKILRDDDIYRRGRDKYLELAFQYYMFT